MENTMDFLVKATPTGRLLDLSADDRDELMAGEREVATALIARGSITWMWRLPGTTTSLAVWNAESVEALDAHLRTLPVFPYNDVEVTALAAHPAFPTSLRAAPAAGSVSVEA
jgi:muconolactone D-isomerase